MAKKKEMQPKNIEMEKSGHVPDPKLPVDFNAPGKWGEEKLDLMKDPEPGNQHTQFNQDGSVTVVDAWGGTHNYNNRAEYEAAQQINSRFAQTPQQTSALEAKGLQGAPSTGDKGKGVQGYQAMKDKVTQENVKKVMAAINPRKEMQPNVDTSLIPQLGDVATNIGTKAAVGATTGAVAGLASVGTLSAPGAVVGAIGGVAYGAATIVSEMKEQAKQNTKVEYASLTTSESKIKAIIDMTNKGQIDPIEGLRLYNDELTRIDQAEANLKKLSESEWSKSKDELVKIQAFNDIGRMQANRMMAEAVARPDATRSVFLDNFPTESEIE